MMECILLTGLPPGRSSDAVNVCLTSDLGPDSTFLLGSPIYRSYPQSTGNQKSLCPQPCIAEVGLDHKGGQGDLSGAFDNSLSVGSEAARTAYGPGTE